MSEFSAAANELPVPVELDRADTPVSLPASQAAVPEQEAEDLALVEQARKGDRASYGELVRRYQERIYATIYHMVGNRTDAEDLTQDTFIKAYQALKAFKGEASFYTWVYRIAVNKTFNFLKQRKHKTHLSLDNVDFNAEHDPEMVELVSEKTPRREAYLKELQQKLNAAMAKLSEVHRLVVVLHDIQGLPHEEIARIMDCNIGTVRSRLFYARQQLQAYLSDYLKRP